MARKGRTLPLDRVSDGVQYQCCAAAGRPGLVHCPLAPRVELEIEIAVKRKSTGQSRSVQVMIPSAELVILETDQDVEW